jgi:type IV pilus assembly protein PilE
MILKRGFTLLEVLIVVIIIGILASIALPQYTATIEKSKSAEAATNIGTIRASLDRYWYQNNYDLTGATLPADGSEGTLDVDNPNAVTNRLYDYAISGLSGSGADRTYTITATRIGKADTWVKWEQTSNVTGKLYRSANLGGPTS